MNENKENYNFKDEIKTNVSLSETTRLQEGYKLVTWEGFSGLYCNPEGILICWSDYSTTGISISHKTLRNLFNYMEGNQQEFPKISSWKDFYDTMCTGWIFGPEEENFYKEEFIISNCPKSEDLFFYWGSKREDIGSIKISKKGLEYLLNKMEKENGI